MSHPPPQGLSAPRHEGVGPASGDHNYTKKIGHDTHAGALAAKLQQPNTSLTSHDGHPLAPVTDALKGGEAVIIELSSGRVRGTVVTDVCSLEELMAGNLHVRLPGNEATERVYRVAYAEPHAGGGGAGGMREKTSLFKRSDLRREAEVVAKEGSLGVGPYAQSTVHRSGALDAPGHERDIPHRKE